MTKFDQYDITKCRVTGMYCATISSLKKKHIGLGWSIEEAIKNYIAFI